MSNDAKDRSKERIYCSQVAQMADAPIHGTAVQVHTWLLIEYARPWTPKAMQDNDLPRDLLNHITALPEMLETQGVLMRTQFIKQAASADQLHPRVFISNPDGLYSREYEHYESLHSLSVEDILKPAAAGFEAHAKPIALVCTNGQRDLCCARFGLPVYESLRTEFGQRAWQTTHVGGHRYAPNVLMLPGGYLFGNVAPEEAVVLQQKYDGGVITLDRLRGKSELSESAQAAEYFLRLAKNLRGLNDLHYEGENQEANSASESQDSSVSPDQLSNPVSVHFCDQQRQHYRVVVAAAASEPVMASCDGSLKPVKQFELISLERE